MTFWQFLTNVWHYLEERGTRVLGVLIGVLTTLTATGIVPPEHLKYYLAAITVMTYLRGQSNADKIADKVVEKTAAKQVPFVQSPETQR